MYGSTVYVFSKHGSFYRASKQSVETLIEVFHEKQGLRYTIIRYGSLYGPRSQPWNGLRRIVNEMVTKKKIVFGGTGKEKREYIHVIDASKMSVDLLDESYLEKAVTLTGIQVLSQSELLEMVAEIMDDREEKEWDDAACLTKEEWKEVFGDGKYRKEDHDSDDDRKERGSHRDAIVREMLAELEAACDEGNEEACAELEEIITEFEEREGEAEYCDDDDEDESGEDETDEDESDDEDELNED
jgi:nucleoside-diphosphate-sugar epimerase